MPEPKKATTCAELDACVRACTTRFLLVKFGAPWCKPCRLAEPRCETLVALYAKTLSWVDVECGHCEELQQRYGLTTIPAFLLLRADGSRVSEQLITGLGEGPASFEAKLVALMSAEHA